MATKKLLTLEQLAKFCEENKFGTFSSIDSGYTLSVQVPGELCFSQSESPDLMYCTTRVCHTQLNRNGSFISEKNMKKAMPTLAYKPVLASIIETDEGLDFNSHDMEFTEDADGNQIVNYIEKQVGTFTTTAPYLEYDNDMDKTYVIAECVIPRGYTQTAEILERKGGSKCSCELCINSMSYNAKEKYLELEDFYFSGVTLLGEHVGEGMLGSRVDIKDFSTDNNSVHFEHDNNLIDMIQKLTDAFDKYTKSIRKEDAEVGQNENFEEVTEIEEVEVTEEATEDEVTTEDDFSEDATDVTPEEDVTEEFTEDENEEVVESEENIVEFSATINGEIKTFSLSLNDKLSAIYSLVNETYGSVDNDFYDVVCYEDNHMIEMHGLFTGKSYRQTYKCKKDSFSLVGDRCEIYSVWMSEEEKNAFESMKSNYSSIESELNTTKETLSKYEAEPEKMSILNSEEYSQIAESDDFVAFKEQDAHFDMSVEDVKAKADAMLLDFAKHNTLTFSVKSEDNHVGHKSLFSTKSETSRYGDIFRK